MNPEQQAAVNLTEGPVICVAGPGSGKTTVIVGRVRHMIELGIEPSSILVVTFTKAAALSMRSRFLANADRRSEKVNFGTFHSIFFNILKTHYGYNSENILKEETAIKLLSEILCAEEDFFSAGRDYIESVLGEIAAYKGLDLDKKKKFSPETMDIDSFHKVFRRYQAMLNELGLVDFEDMLLKTWELLATDENACRKWQDKFRYILVDEFQDINPLQYRITRLLAAPQNNLFIVGDDDQSIYSFRGAAPGIMAAFPKDYPDAKMVSLTVNYRSSNAILEKAMAVIRNNRDRYDKALTAANPQGEEVVVKSFPESSEEYSFVCDCISKEIRGGRQPKEIAVLVRTNLQAGGICTKLMDAGIPFVTKSGLPSIFDNRHLKPLLAYLRFASGDHSRANFILFMNKPVRYIEKASLLDEDVDLDKLLDFYHKLGKDYVVRNISNLIKDVSYMRQLDPKTALLYIRNVIGYDEFFRKDSGMSGAMLDEVYDLFNELEDAAAPHKSYAAFFDYIEKYKERMKMLKLQNPADSVNVLTYHGCKGLEFDSVYMPDCEEGLTPHKKSKEGGAISEERRMFYVALTRAKTRLTVTASSRRGGRDMTVSRFMNEMRRTGRRPEAGTRIFHTTYKEGTVIHVDGDALTVKFDRLLVPKKLSYGVCLEKGLIEVY